MESGRQDSADERQTRLRQRLDVLTRRVSIGAVLLALSIVARSVYLVLSGTARLDNPLNMAMYFGLPICLAAGMLGALCLRPLQRARVLMLCGSAGIAAYALELILQITAPTTQPQSAITRVSLAADKAAAAARFATKFGVSVDTRSADDALRDLRKADTGAIPILTPGNNLFERDANGAVKSATQIDGVEVMPLAGPSNRTTLLCNENGPWVHYRADRHGFNNPDGVWQSGTLEIALLGDSFAQGYCVPPSHSFAGLVQQRQPKTLNLGIAGDGPLLMLATLTEHLTALQPRIVLWCYFEGNDLEDLQVERQSALLSNYLRDGFRQTGLRDQSAVDRAILARRRQSEAAPELPQRYFWNTATYTAVSFAKLTALRYRLGLIRPIYPHEIEAAADFEKANVEGFRDVLQTAQRRVASWGGQLYFVYLPNWEAYTARYRARGNGKRGTVLDMARELSIPVIDVDPVFRSSGDPLAFFPFRQLGHYTETGHRLVAETIMRELASPQRTLVTTASTVE